MKITIRKHHNSQTVWMIFFLVFPNIKPSSIAALVPLLSQAYNVLSYVSFAVVLIMIIRSRRTIIQPVMTLILLMELWIFIATFLHQSDDMLSNITSFISGITIPLIIYAFSDRMEELLTALLMNFEWLIYASLISIFIYYPNGMYISGTKIQYFLGNENGIIFYVIPALFLVSIYMKMKHKYVRGSLLIAACLANEVIVWCATGIVGLFIAGILVAISIRRRKLINYYIILVGSLIADFFITILRTFDQYNFLTYIINDLLNRSLTLSGRIKIWDQAVTIIEENFMTGLGRGDHVILKGIVFHAHNEYFQILLIGGIPLLLIFLYLLFYLGKRLNDTENNTYARLMCMAMLACLFIQFIATSRLTFRLYVPLMLASYINDIDKILPNKERIEGL